MYESFIDIMCHPDIFWFFWFDHNTDEVLMVRLRDFVVAKVELMSVYSLVNRAVVMNSVQWCLGAVVKIKYFGVWSFVCILCCVLLQFVFIPVHSVLCVLFIVFIHVKADVVLLKQMLFC